MANGILDQLNKSLELTLREGLAGLEDFTLQMAYASAGEQFEILSIDDSFSFDKSLPVVDTTPSAKPSENSPSTTAPAVLKLVKTDDTDDIPQTFIRRQRRA